MMAKGGNKDRDVLFRLGVEAYPGTKAALRQLATEIEATQKKITATMKATTDAIMEQVAATRRAHSFMNVVSGGGSRRSGSVTVGDDTPSGRERGRTDVKAHLATVEADYKKHGDRLVKSRQDVSKEHKKILEREGEFDKIWAEKKKIAAAMNLKNDVQFMQLSVSEMRKVWMNRTRLVADYYAKERRERETAQVEETAKLRQLERVRDSALIKMSKREQMLPARFSALVGSVMQLTRGLVTMGAVSEDSSEKMLKKLLTVQGAFDAVIGTVRSAQGIFKFFGEVGTIGRLSAKANAAQSGINSILSGTVSQTIQGGGFGVGETAAQAILSRGRGKKARGASGGSRGGGRSGGGGGVVEDIVSGVTEQVAEDGFEAIFDGVSKRAKAWRNKTGKSAINLLDLAKKEQAGELLSNAMGATGKAGKAGKAVKWASSWADDAAAYTASQAVGRTVAGGAAGGGISSMIGSAAAVIAPLAGTVAAFGAALVGATAGAKVLTEVLSGNTGKGSWTDTVASAEVGMYAKLQSWLPDVVRKSLNKVGPYGAEMESLYQGNKSLEEQKKRGEEKTIDLERDRGLGAAEATAMRSRFGIDDRRQALRASNADLMFRPNRASERAVMEIGWRASDVASRKPSLANSFRSESLNRQMRSARESLIPEDMQRAHFSSGRNMSDTRQALVNAQVKLTALESASGGKPSAEVDAQSERVAELHSRMMEATKERANVEKQIAETRRSSIRESLQGIQQEIAQRRNAQREAEDSYKSGKERFGSMSTLEQAKLISLKRKADTAADASTSDEEKSFMSGTDRVLDSGFVLDAGSMARRESIQKRRAQASAAGLTRQERERLASVGTEYTSQIASEGGLMTAEAMGYDKYFADEERRKVRTEKAAADRLQVELKDKRPLEIKIESDVNEIVRAAVNAIQAHNAQSYRGIERKVQEQLSRDKTQVMEQFNAQQAARRNA